VNAFIPTLIAVLLAETGGRSAAFARLPRLTLAATVLGLAVSLAAIAGFAIAPTMTPYARALMLGVALILTGAGQFGTNATVEPPTSVVATLALVWRTGVPLLAFAFAIWSGSTLGPVAGAITGFVGAVAIGAILSDATSPHLFRWVRRGAGTAITVIGIYAALWALRLV
jgi:Ca2+/H+ antiporter, TMEM165/GDT1 family